MISLTLSLSDIEFEKDTPYDKNNTVCTVFLNGTSIDKLYATQNDDRTNLSLNKSSDKVQLVFRTKDNSELIGCISLNYDHFVNLTEKEFSQWYDQNHFYILTRIGFLSQLHLKKMTLKELLVKMTQQIQEFSFHLQ